MHLNQYNHTKLKVIPCKFSKSTRSIVEECKTTVVELTELHKNVNITKVSGNSASLLGGILCVAGLALAPLTLGTSLGLTITGGVIGGAGGLTSTVGSLFEMNKQKEKLKILSTLLEDDNSRLDEITQLFPEIDLFSQPTFKGNLEHSSDRDVFEYLKVGKYVAWNLVANPIVDGIKLASVAGRTARVGVKAFPLVGNILMLPVDIGFLAHSAIELSQQKVPEICEKINAIIERLEKPLNELEKVWEEHMHHHIITFQTKEKFLSLVFYQRILDSSQYSEL